MPLRSTFGTGAIEPTPLVPGRTSSGEPAGYNVREAKPREHFVAIAIRYYIFGAEGAFSHVPQRVVEGLHLGQDALPQFASSTQRAAEVVVENQNGKPARILDVQGRQWVFDKEGKLEKREGNLWFSLRGDGEKPRGKVVDLRPEIERNKWRARNLWDVTKEDLDRITGALWPELVDDPLPVQSVKGKAPKRPPLTSQAQRAIGEIASKISLVSDQLEGLTEPGLKGLAFEARRLAQSYNEDRGLWGAVADEADRQREIKARHRTGTGVWFAVLQIWMATEDRSEMRELETIDERCEGKDAAIEAGRRLLAQHADKFSENVTLEPAIYCDLEWRPSTEAESEMD
jgi:hypothetical protein